MAMIGIDGYKGYWNSNGTRSIIINSDHIEECMMVYRKNSLDSVAITVANLPTKVIKQGASGHISIKFDSHGKSGLQRKFITVFSNSIKDIKILSFEGNVQSTIKS